MEQKAIGGYFELELPGREEYHREALALNTGRNCLEYILRLRGYKKVFVPYYTCEVVLEPLRKLCVEYEFYHINKDFTLREDIRLHANEALLYTNYYGLQTAYVETLTTRYASQLIVDNTQAFYSKPLKNIDSFNTCRKFFGTADGAYCFTDKRLDEDFEQDVSVDRMSFLLKRIDVGAEQGYEDFRTQSEALVGMDIRLMSPLTHRIMASIDYDKVKRARRANFLYLHSVLSSTNELNLCLKDDEVPMVYPYLISTDGLREKLIRNKIFVARYWPNVLDWTKPSDDEYYLTEHLLPLPIDQRYDKEDMKRIVEHMS